MNTQSILSGRFSRRHTASGAALLMALFGIVPVYAVADGSAAATTLSRATAVSLSDLDLSTAQGMRLARDRLHTMAEHVCAESGSDREPSSHAAFDACVDSTVANALRQISALSQAHTTVRNSVTRSATVPLADLNLSTLEGARIARERLEAMARRLCGELARRQDLYQPDYAACVHDSLAAGEAQADALAAANTARTARRSAP
jgi:UrcA family protein